MSSTPESSDYRFPPERRVLSSQLFSRIIAQRVVSPAGPLRIYTAPNDRSHPRLGLVTSRKVGNAVVRNRIRRLIRESFRLLQHELPAGYDLIVMVSQHEPLALSDYQRLLKTGSTRAVKIWERRQCAKPKTIPTQPPIPPEHHTDESVAPSSG